jgi:selenocysteine lyase/cysteine desulfurase
MMLHLNNAGASPMSDRTLATVVDHLHLERDLGPYEAANSKQEALTSVKEAIGTLVHSTAGSVALTDGATRAWNSLVYGLALQQGDEVWTSQLEFGSTLGSLADVCERQGANLRIAPTDNVGRIDVAALAQAMTDRTRLVAIAHAPAHLPLLNPIGLVDELTASRDVPLLIDACQTAGICALPVLRTSRNAICGTGRKWLRGPRGTGFLAVSEAWTKELLPPTVDLANANVEDLSAEHLAGLDLVTDGRRFELWERNIAAVLGLGVAVNEALEIGIARVGEVGIEKSNRLKAGFSGALSSRLVCGEYQETPVICLALKQGEDSLVREYLAGHGLNHSIMGNWDAPIDFRRRNLTKILRLSPHFQTTDDDIAAAGAILDELPL